MTLLPEPDPLPTPDTAAVPVGDAAGRLLAAMFAVADAVADDREPELAQTGSRA